MKRSLLLAIVVLLLPACGSTQSADVPPTLTPLETRGRAVFDSVCANCHSTIEESIIIGPSLAGVATRGVERVVGMDAETYIRESLLNPTAYTVEGYPENVMPATLAEQLPAEDIDAVVAYLLTLTE